MADNTTLTDNEQVKLDIINAVLIKKIKTGQAARILGITSRQVQRLKKEVKREGAQGVVHKLKGKISNNHIDPSVKEKVLQKIRTRYYDFKPGFATEKLKEEYDDRNQLIIPTSQTVRMWMNESGLWKTHKQSTEAGDHGKSIMENLSSLMDRITIGLRTGTKIKVAVLLKYVFFCRLMMQQERSLMLSLPITRELLQYLPSGNHMSP